LLLFSSIFFGFFGHLLLLEGVHSLNQRSHLCLLVETHTFLALHGPIRDTNPTSWIIVDCMPDGFEWKDLSKIQIDNIYRLLDHWKACQDSGLELLVWASTGPLFQDNNKTAKNLQAS
jgi:hypothetical protein